MFDFVFSENKQFEVCWNRFVLENANITWRYTLNWYKFQLACLNEDIITNLSFIVVKNNQILAICPLFLEKHNNRLSFSFRNSYQNAPVCNISLTDKKYRELEKTIFDKIDELASKHNVGKIMFLIDSTNQKEQFNYLVKYHYLDSSINTAIIKLHNSISDLWSHLRKSYKSIINNGLKKYELVIMDSKNPDEKAHAMYQKLHHKAAGKLTRSNISFDLEFDMLCKNNAILIGLKNKDMYIAMSYFYHNGKNAYYGSSADDPVFSKNIAYEHTILWKAIEYYKERGFASLELGWQLFGHQIFEHPSEKEIDISFFKRGFGGNIVPLFRGIKYFDKDLMVRELNDTIHSLQEQFK